MANATVPTGESPSEFVAGVEPAKRRAEGEQLLSLMAEVTGDVPVMWGPTMIGFGTYAYRYASGREGVFLRVGFSPRKAALSLYGLKDHESAEPLLAALGPHTASVGCLYVKNLAALDLDALRELVRIGYAQPKLYEV